MAPETVVTVDNNKPANAPPPQQGRTFDWIKIDVNYFKTPPGFLKIIELVSTIRLTHYLITYFIVNIMFITYFK